MPRTTFVAEHVQVRGSQDRTYLVTSVGIFPLACSCPDFVHRAGPRGESCKHMRARSGLTSLGATRCAQCMVMLTIAELDAQPREADVSAHLAPRFCMLCSSGVAVDHG